MKKKISIIGLGYVGLPLALSFQKFFNVIGFDINHKRICELKKNYDSNNEFSYSEIARAKNLNFSNNVIDITNSDFIIITVPTPINKKKKPDLGPLKNACKIIAKYIKINSIIIFESTVYPTCTENVCIPLLEKYSKKKINRDFYVGYSPERINVGDKKHGLENVVKIVSGSSKIALTRIRALYRKIIAAGLHSCQSITTAEAAKAIENAQRDINIAFINEVTTLFNKLGLRAYDVFEAARTKWNFINFDPGLVGGHCIGVDPYYLNFIAKKNRIKSNVISSGRFTNDSMHINLSDIFLKKIKKNFSKLKKFQLLILGLSFKENTNDIRNSRVFELCEYLKKKGHGVSVYDPLVNNRIKSKNFRFYTDLKIKKKFHGILLAVPHKKIIKNIKLVEKLRLREAVFLDIKNIFGLSNKQMIKKLNIQSI